MLYLKQAVSLLAANGLTTAVSMKPWGGFYAIGHLDGQELHLKEAPRTNGGT